LEPGSDLSNRSRAGTGEGERSKLRALEIEFGNMIAGTFGASQRESRSGINPM
jgi:hypothetical protein